MVDSAAQLVSERERTHGKYRSSAALCQTLKAVVRAHMAHSNAETYQLEAIEMVLFKLSRIVSGDASYADHWRDVAGYATLVVKELEKR